MKREVIEIKETEWSLEPLRLYVVKYRVHYLSGFLNFYKVRYMDLFAEDELDAYQKVTAKWNER